MRKTNKPAKAVDHDNIKGPRRTKPTKRFEFWYKYSHGQWCKVRTYESQEEAVLMGKKRLREFDSKWMNYKIIDKITQEVIWQSPDIKENPQSQGYTMPEVTIASDYAVLHTAGLRFYYGYESTAQDGLWCFSVEQGSEVIFEMSHEALGANDMFEVTECLLLGIAQWMEHTKQALDSQEA